MQKHDTTPAASPVGSSRLDAAPPASHTGAQNTVLFDCLTWTFPDSLSFADLFPMLPADGWIELPRGGLGYKRGFQQGHVKLFRDGNEGMGQHAQLMGQACRELEGAGLRDWQGFLAYWRDLGGKPSRVDAAIDDFSGVVTVDRLVSLVGEGAVTTRFKVGDLVQRFLGGDGSTAYFGDAGSRVRVRVYDKAAEQAQKGKGVDPTRAVWTRVELQMRDERAARFVDAFIERGSLGEVACGVIRQYIQVREPSGDSNRSRWPEAEWWLSWLGGVARIRLTVLPEVPTLEKVNEYLRGQVAPTLAAWFQALGGSLDEVTSLLDFGRSRWRAKHRLLVAGYG